MKLFKSLKQKLDKQIIDLDVYGGVMGRREFVRKLKRTIQLIEKRRVWIDESIYNSPQDKLTEALIELEKQVNKEYDESVRGGKATEDVRQWNEGRLDLLTDLKDIIKHGTNGRETS